MELETQNKIIDILRHDGWVVLRVNSGRRGGVAFNFWYAPIPKLNEVMDVEDFLRLQDKPDRRTSGASDLFAWKLGFPTLVIETKSRQGKLSPDQAEFLDYMKKAGALTVYPKSEQEFLEFYRNAVLTEKVIAGIPG